MNRHWTIGGPPESDDKRDEEARPEVRPWQPGVATPPQVRTPQFMLGGRLAEVREPRFMRRILPRVVVPALEPNPSESRRSPNKNHGK
jgi:hypothetical protein